MSNARLSVHQRASLWDTIDRADDWFGTRYGNTDIGGDYVTLEIDFQSTAITLFFSSIGDVTAKQEYDLFATKLIDELKSNLFAVNH